MKKLITIMCVFATFISNAQWTTDTDVNTLVADSEPVDMQAIGTPNGQTYVVFWKAVPAPVNMELRLQVLDADGNQTLGSDGVLVSDQIPMSTYTVIWDLKVDTDSNLYIGVTGTDSGNPAHVFKMDTGGNQLWGTTSGLHVGDGYNVTLLPLSTGGLLLSWLDIGTNGAVMQKLDSTGNPVWPANQPIELTGSDTAPANLFEISGDEYIVVFHEMLFGISSILYAQRYDADGNPVWAAPVQLAGGTTAFNRKYTGIQDGDVVYMGYFSSASNRFDSFLQRIDPDGTLPWGINGADFDTSQANYEMNTEIAFSPGSDYLWAIARYTNSAQSNSGEYVQKFDKTTGTRMFTDAAKEIFPISSDKVHQGRLWLKDNSPLFLMKEGFDNGVTPTTLHAVHLDENGDFEWPEETRPLATFAANKGRVHYTRPVNHQSVAVFVEDKGAGSKIYAQNFVDEELATEDFSAVSILYVNPVKTELILQSSAGIEAISIYTILGQQIFKAEYNGQNAININTQNWSSGMYFMKVATNKGVKKGIKLIKR